MPRLIDAPPNKKRKRSGQRSVIVWSYLPRILRYVRPYWKLATISVTLTVLSAMAALLAPWPLKVIVDSVLGDHPLRRSIAALAQFFGAGKFAILVFAVVAGLVIVAVEHGLTVLHSYVTTTFEQKMILDFRSDMFQHAQRLSLAYHDRKRSGGIIYAINFQAHAAAGVVMAAQPLAQSAIMLVGMFIITYRINATLALVAISIVPFLYYSVGYYATHIQDRLMKVKRMEGESLSIIHEAMSMLRVIVAFGRESHEFGRFRRQGERATDARIHLTVRQTLFSLAVNTITAIGTSMVLGVGAYYALKGRLTTGELLVVLAYIASIYRPLEAISTTIGSLQNQFVGLRIAFRLMDTEPEIRDAPDAMVVGRTRGNVEFDHVDFDYRQRAGTLRDISFSAKANQVIAIAGPTGAGKTTLISLLPRFYDVKRGRVLVDGVDVRKIALRSLREQISIVLQEPLLFSGTIADNIHYGRLSATMPEIVAAAEAANAHDFITALPHKYETPLGERGSLLSLGERQRIAVARAFLKDAPILILDEPTSSIDSKTESIILDALDRLMAGRTTFMIAHRLSTIRHADMILVMDHGEIVQSGTHDELVAQEGLYQQLFQIQTAERRRERVRLAPPEMV